MYVLSCTGRLPFHVNIYNDDPTKPGAGIPANMTVIATKLKTAGYTSHFIGKWHVGMADKATHTPEARGFSSSLGYFHARNSYYTSEMVQGCGKKPAVDLWDSGSPATFNGTEYEERLFARRAQKVLTEHNTTDPLFLYYAFHTSAWGYDVEKGGSVQQPDPEFLEKFAFIDDVDRRANHATVALMDEVVGNITDTLKQRGMWNNTLLLWSSDNGGAVHLGGGANVWPLRGGYENNWEGGIRAAAFLSGGYLPQNVSGTKLEGFIHEADWYATFCHLAGVDPTDHKAAEAEPPLPPIDSHNVWALITGTNKTSPRTEWALTPFGEDLQRSSHGGDAAYMSEGRYKLIVGVIQQAGWCGQVHPNVTVQWDSYKTIENCTVPEIGKLGCLFDVLEDPTEHNDLALKMPDKALEILQKMEIAERTWFNPDRGAPSERACEIAAETGYWQPFM